MPRKQSGQKKKQKDEAKKQKKNENKVKIDPTFGLKNKKGSKNRRFVQNAQHNMNADEIRKKQERAEKKKQKALEERLKREEEALFKTVDTSAHKKKKKKKGGDDDEENKVEIDDETLLNECPLDELDELIDRLRVKFENRTDLTPVNPDTFKAWLERKEREKEEQQQEKVKKKLAKQGKKGLTGRELFSLTPSIFKDDEDATEEIVFEKEQKQDTDDAQNADDDQAKQTDADDAEIGDKNESAEQGKEKEQDALKSINEIGDASLFLENDDLLNDMEIID